MILLYFLFMRIIFYIILIIISIFGYFCNIIGNDVITITVIDFLTLFLVNYLIIQRYIYKSIIIKVKMVSLIDKLHSFSLQ
jgi:hypothetical protein